MAAEWWEVALTDDALEAKIAAWHEAPSDSYVAQMELHEYLGWTWEQFKIWTETGEMPNN